LMQLGRSVKRPNQDDLLNTNFLIGSKTVARQQVAGAQVWDRALAGLMLNYSIIRMSNDQ